MSCICYFLWKKATNFKRGTFHGWPLVFVPNEFSSSLKDVNENWISGKSVLDANHQDHVSWIAGTIPEYAREWNTQSPGGTFGGDL